jgi:hypothetical protein
LWGTLMTDSGRAAWWRPYYFSRIDFSEGSRKIGCLQQLSTCQTR